MLKKIFRNIVENTRKDRQNGTMKNNAINIQKFKYTLSQIMDL
jgi:hypothetical protein